MRFDESASSSIRDNLESAWKSIQGNSPFVANFVSQNSKLEFMQEKNEGKVLLTFAMLAIFVSCIGLYGLASFTIKSKVKEIGIRKVLGANFKTIMALFIWQFSKPVLVASIIAAPISLWVTLTWLQRFEEQIDYRLLLPLFLFAGTMALIIACLTVASTTAKAAREDPVISLRYE